MLRSNCRQALDNIRAYIVESVDLDYFGLEEAPDYKTACRLVMEACHNEKAGIRYKSSFEMFRDWAQGLPTAFNTLYYYNVSAVDLLADWLNETNSEKARFTEEQAEERITALLFRELTKGGGYNE